eukprot:155388-Pleurochrysis_carterae.AAC.1
MDTRHRRHNAYCRRRGDSQPSSPIPTHRSREQSSHSADVSHGAGQARATTKAQEGQDGPASRKAWDGKFTPRNDAE